MQTKIDSFKRASISRYLFACESQFFMFQDVSIRVFDFVLMCRPFMQRNYLRNISIFLMCVRCCSKSTTPWLILECRFFSQGVGIPSFAPSLNLSRSTACFTWLVRGVSICVGHNGSWTEVPIPHSFRYILAWCRFPDGSWRQQQSRSIYVALEWESRGVIWLLTGIFQEMRKRCHKHAF